MNSDEDGKHPARKIGTAAVAGKRPKPRRKPRDMPKRPLSAYNLFFKQERELILENQREGISQPDFVFPGKEELERQAATGKKKAPVLFQALARCIGQRWRALPRERVREFEEQAKIEMEAYRKKMAEYQQTVVQKAIEENERKASAEDAEAKQQSLQSDDDDEESGNNGLPSSAEADIPNAPEISLSSVAQLEALSGGVQQLAQYNPQLSQSQPGLADNQLQMAHPGAAAAFNPSSSHHALLGNATALSAALLQRQQEHQLLSNLQQVQALQQQQQLNAAFQVGVPQARSGIFPQQQSFANSLVGAPWAATQNSQLLAQLQIARLQQQHSMAVQMYQRAGLQQALGGGATAPITSTNQLQQPSPLELHLREQQQRQHALPPSSAREDLKSEGDSDSDSQGGNRASLRGERSRAKK
eukprot:CAMPEP_0172460288 /NCGR_PEP_ID=MMETSP1065-20121228/36279_1 /TAXON_ID=265537 /ORGANISM="Amphiprora paludosa, Strain CCMP125" /LENGTH=415 /DNA_ID=CAMNT_0013215271 /DNA_START=314 /DNA_END=1561 /DNA_ORIENTATION=-